jgi:hypothetical protein
VFADSDWRATEELALLEAVELYGFGNWEDTAALVSGRRSAEDVRQHSIKYYVKGSVGRETWSHASPDTYQAVDHTCSRDGNLSPSLTTPLPAIPELSLPEQQHLGYMPKRDDFEKEFDNEVEMLISTLRINPNDEDDLDVDLKVAHIDMYNRRLRQRFRKKAVVRDYGLVSQFYKSLSGDPEIMSLIHPQSSPSTAVTSLVSEKAAVPVSVSSGVSDSSPASHSGRLQSSPSSPANGKSHHSSPNHLIPESAACLTHNRITSNGLTASPVKKRSLSPGKCATPSDPLLTAAAASDRMQEQLRDKFKIFSQFQSALDQKQLLDNLRRERDLKARIKDLVRYRKSGIRKLSEVAGMESARNDRDKRKENKKKVRTLSSVSSCSSLEAGIVFFDEFDFNMIQFSGRRYSLRSQITCQRFSGQRKRVQSDVAVRNGQRHVHQLIGLIVKDESDSGFKEWRQSAKSGNDLLQIGPMSEQRRRRTRRVIAQRL